MNIYFITPFPELVETLIRNNISNQGIKKNLVNIDIINLRDFSNNKHKQIDDKPFGGGPGMLLKPEPFFECIEKLLSERNYDHIIFTIPKGKIYDQKIANKLSLAKNIMIIAGHYKGIDDRVRERFSTDELSIGNFVLSGGELPALVIADSIVRLLPGTLNDSESALNDSFMDGEYIEAPYYTRPAEFKGMKVPDVLLSGNEKKIKDWKKEQSKLMTENWKNINSTE